MKKYDEEKQDAYEGVSESFKPLIDVQKSVKESIDEKQDELIKQLQENQNQIVQAIEFDPKKAITYEGEPLPALEDVYDEHGEEIEDVEEEVKVKKPTKSVKIFNLDKGINDEYKELLLNKNLELPSNILEKNMDVNNLIKKSRE